MVFSDVGVFVYISKRVILYREAGVLGARRPLYRLLNYSVKFLSRELENGKRSKERKKKT